MDQRPASRARTIMQGRIVFANRSGSLDCIIRNLSDTGAKVEVSGAVTLPERFELQIPRKGETRRARIVWRRVDVMGVTFETVAGQSPGSDGITARLKSAQDENARLRLRVAELSARANEH